MRDNIDLMSNDTFRHSKAALCNECGSLYYIEESAMTMLCPECAHILYGYPACEHVFVDGRCKKCYWNGTHSKYIQSQIAAKEEQT